MEAPPPLRVVLLTLPAKLLGLSHVVHHISDLLMPVTIDSAVYKGFERVVRLYGPFRAWTAHAMDGAAVRGRLDIVQWLHDHRSEGCSTAAALGASTNGHLQVLMWLHEVYPELCYPVKEITVAAKHGHTEVVKFLRPGLSRDDVVFGLEATAANGHVNAMEALLPGPVDLRRSFIAAAGNGHTSVLHFLLDKGYGNPLVDTSPDLGALLYGHVNVVELLFGKCDEYVISDALAAAVDGRHMNVVELVLKRCYPGKIALTFALERAVRSGQCDMVSLLSRAMSSG